MKKIPKKFTPILFAFIMATGMATIMSFALTAINTGFDGAFCMRWARSLVIGVMIAFPAALVISPIARKIVGGITE
jgi:hypothetical protein